MTIIKFLKDAGCDVETAIKRCDNDEEFYLELVESALKESRYSKISEQLDSQDWKGAFESSHALKGVVSNLSLAPLVDIACELTEKLRPMKECDCTELMTKLLEARKMICQGLNG
ncbi:Hpt domain-containing protein [uncultured Treponema sp.]|uniref:Hpt domain-containing protein n=1 Tax=uncultured Treponema sp. TaxID=162155 RepID=UPI0025FABDF6|nr:Hpt domain-containing protein [uncultured Treponema sp.]